MTASRCHCIYILKNDDVILHTRVYIMFNVRKLFTFLYVVVQKNTYLYSEIH